MTPISAVDPMATDVQSDSPVKILGKDDFLNMLIAQLQHQDPLNPADSTEFTAQLAQFSSLEQLSNINDSLKNMEAFQASLTHSQAVSYIGKEVTAAGNGLLLEEGQPAICRFELEAATAMTAVSIYDATGGFVDSFETGQLGAGRQRAMWDGTDFNGNKMPSGVYEFEIQAVDAGNQNVVVTPLARALVTGVSFKDNSAYLMTGLQAIAIEDVIDVSEAPPPPTETETVLNNNTNQQPNGGL